MAEGRLTKDEVSVKDIYGNIIDSAKKLDTQLEKTNEEFKKQATLLKLVTTESEKYSQKSLDKMMSQQKKVDNLEKKAQANDKIKLKNIKALERARVQELQLQKKREKSIDDYNKKEAKAVIAAQK